MCECVCVCVCARKQAYGTCTVNSGWRTGVTNDSTRCSAGRGISIISNERNHRTMRYRPGHPKISQSVIHTASILFTVLFL